MRAPQAAEGWGAAVIPRLVLDIRNELPEQKGFSVRNINLMAQFFRTYPTLFAAAPEFVQPPVAQLESRSKVPQAVALSRRGSAQGRRDAP